jgi:hypothetical protein
MIGDSRCPIDVVKVVTGEDFEASPLAEQLMQVLRKLHHEVFND